MAFVCEDCELIFKTKKNNCPYCGGKIYSVNDSSDVLLRKGYSYFENNSNAKASRSSSADSFSVNDGDIISSLRQQYYREHLTQNQPASTQEQNITTAPTPTPAPVSVDRGNSHDETHENNSNGGYFSQFTSSSNSEEIPTIAHSQPIPSSINTSSGSSYTNNNQALQRQQRRIRNNYRRATFMDFVSNIRWRTVFRVLAIVLVIILAIVIWNNRQAIYESIMNFIFQTIVPILIIGAIIVYVFKSIFKK